MKSLHTPVSTRLDSLPDPLRALIGAELERDERIRWIGRPIVGRLVWHHSWFLCLFGLGFAPMMLVLMAFMYFEGAAWWAGLPFLLFSLAVISSPWWALRRARLTAYLITDRRALSCHAAYPVAVHSYPFDTLEVIERSQRPDGSGDLAGFLALRDVSAVERILRDALLQQTSSS